MNSTALVVYIGAQNSCKVWRPMLEKMTRRAWRGEKRAEKPKQLVDYE